MKIRLDGRKADELRPINIQPNFTRYAEGSVLFCIGDTQVLCNATIEDGVPKWMQQDNKIGGWITAEYAMLPRSTQNRISRETLRPRGRTQEIRRIIGRSLRAGIDLKLIGSRTCIIDCDVLQADGGTRTAAINGGYIALYISLKKLILNGLIHEQAIKNQVAAISAGIIDHTPYLDLNYDEDSQAEVDANIVMVDSGEFVEIQTTGEACTFNRTNLLAMLDLAYQGIGELLSMQRKVIDELIFPST